MFKLMNILVFVKIGHLSPGVLINPPPPHLRWTFSEASTEKLQLQSHFKSWVSIDPPPKVNIPEVSTEKLQLQSHFKSWVLIDPPQPKVNISRGEYRKVAVAKSLQKLSVDWPPTPHLRWTFSGVSTEKLQLQSHFKSWVSIDPPKVNIFRGEYRKVTFAKSLQKLSVDRPPQPPHPHLRWTFPEVST